MVVSKQPPKDVDGPRRSKRIKGEDSEDNSIIVKNDDPQETSIVVKNDNVSAEQSTIEQENAIVLKNDDSAHEVVEKNDDSAEQETGIPKEEEEKCKDDDSADHKEKSESNEDEKDDPFNITIPTRIVRELNRSEQRLINAVFLYSTNNRKLGDISAREFHFVALKNKLWKINVSNTRKFLDTDLSVINRKLLQKGETTIWRQTYEAICDYINTTAIDNVIVKSVSPDDKNLERLSGSDGKLTGMLYNIALYLEQLKPKRWANQVTKKLNKAGIDSIEDLETSINDETLQSKITTAEQRPFHKTTIAMLNKAIKMELPDDLTFIQHVIEDFQSGGE